MLLKGRGSAPDRAFEASLQDQPFEHAVQMAQQHDIAAQPGEGEMELPVEHQTLISEILLDQLFVAMIDRAQLGEFKIGRAPCRDRVCQYVYISGVEVALKKTKHN